MRISLVQYSASGNVADNFEKAMALSEQAIKERPDIICYPENFLHSGPQRPNNFEIDCQEVRAFQTFAKKHNVNLVLGSIKIKNGAKLTNTCLVINRGGEIVHRYDKIFMYTINKDGVVFDEADEVESGKRLGLFELDGIKMGVGICVDIRFPFYFSELAKHGAQVIFLPAVMRKMTGKRLWEVLPIARAIENQVYFCACSQTKNLGASKTGDAVGNSKIISFDGEVMQEIGEEDGVCTAKIDLATQEKFRKEVLMLDQFNREFKE